MTIITGHHRAVFYDSENIIGVLKMLIDKMEYLYGLSACGKLMAKCRPGCGKGLKLPDSSFNRGIDIGVIG